jgi:small-conductance mechanosensitive channel
MENKINLGLVTKKTTVEKIIHKLYEDGYIQFPLPIKLYDDFKRMEREQLEEAKIEGYHKDNPRFNGKENQL